MNGFKVIIKIKKMIRSELADESQNAFWCDKQHVFLVLLQWWWW